MITNLNPHAVEVTLCNQLGYERIAMECSASFAKIFGCPADRIWFIFNQAAYGSS
jgi:hypothetical protein